MNRNPSVILLAVAVVALGVISFQEHQTIALLQHSNDILKEASLRPARQETISVNKSLEAQKQELMDLRAEVAKLRGDSEKLAQAQREFRDMKNQKILELASQKAKTMIYQKLYQKLLSEKVDQENLNQGPHDLR